MDHQEIKLRKQLSEQLVGSPYFSDAEIYALIDRLIQSNAGSVCLKERMRLRTTLFHSVRGLDILEELLADDSVTEIMINGPEQIFIERAGKITRWDNSFPSMERLEDVIRQIAGACNRTVNEQKPIADARLQNGARVNIVLPPISLSGPVVTIRRFPDEPISVQELIGWGSLTEEAAIFLKQLVGAGYTILIGGGTSTGKTTLLNVLSGFIPETERIITIEDNAELQLQGNDNLVRLEARSGNIEGENAITLRDLIRTALRMRPDRIIIGEVRGAEAGDWMTCLNTGHQGSLGSAHANSVKDMIGRLESMILMGISLPIPVIRAQIASGIEILVHLKRDDAGQRRVDEITEITGIADDRILLNPIFKRDGRVLKCIGALNKDEKWRQYARKTEGYTG